MLGFMNITKALSEENRVRILMALSGEEEICVCRIIDLLELAPSTVSKHLFLLKNARLIIGRKQGRWTHYRLNTDETASKAVKKALEWVGASLSEDPVVLKDRERLNGILAADSEDRCR